MGRSFPQGCMEMCQWLWVVRQSFTRFPMPGSPGRTRTYDKPVNPGAPGLYLLSKFSRIHRADFIPLISFSRRIAEARSAWGSDQTMRQGPRLAAYLPEPRLESL